MPFVVPAILTADQKEASSRLAVLCEKQLPLHIDVIDAEWGIPTLLPADWVTLRSTIPTWPAYVECHLMVDDPLSYFNHVSQLAQTVIVHVETIHDYHKLAAAASAAQLNIVLTAKPDTALQNDLTAEGWQIMGVNPGAAGQKQRPDTPLRVAAAATGGRATILSVDGGVTLNNASTLVEAGANRLVVNSAYWQAADPDRFFRSLTSIVAGGEHGVSGSD